MNKNNKSNILSFRIPNSLYDKLMLKVQEENYRDISELIRHIILSQLLEFSKKPSREQDIILFLEALLNQLKKHHKIQNGLEAKI